MQPFCSGTKGHGLGDDDDFYKDFSMEDMDLSMENYEELFGVSQYQSQQFFENGGMDSLFGIGKVPGAMGTRAKYAAEVTSFNLSFSFIWACLFLSSLLPLLPILRNCYSE